MDNLLAWDDNNLPRPVFVTSDNPGYIAGVLYGHLSIVGSLLKPAAVPNHFEVCYLIFAVHTRAYGRRLFCADAEFLTTLSHAGAPQNQETLQQMLEQALQDVDTPDHPLSTMDFHVSGSAMYLIREFIFRALSNPASPQETRGEAVKWLCILNAMVFGMMVRHPAIRVHQEAHFEYLRLLSNDMHSSAEVSWLLCMEAGLPLRPATFIGTEAMYADIPPEWR